MFLKRNKIAIPYRYTTPAMSSCVTPGPGAALADVLGRGKLRPKWFYPFDQKSWNMQCMQYVSVSVCVCVCHTLSLRVPYTQHWAGGMAAVSLAMPMKLWESAGWECGRTFLYLLVLAMGAAARSLAAQGRSWASADAAWGPNASRTVPGRHCAQLGCPSPFLHHFLFKPCVFNQLS